MVYSKAANSLSEIGLLKEYCVFSSSDIPVAVRFSEPFTLELEDCRCNIFRAESMSLSIPDSTNSSADVSGET